MKHLAIIMDWNRRWAHERWLPKVMWHKAWADNIEKVVKLASNKGIEYITLWWLSTENLIKRDEEEVKNLIKIINNAPKYLKNLLKNNVKLELIWDIKKLPEKSQEILNNLVEKTKNNNKITLVLALVYWWKDEIIRWIKNFVNSWGDIENLDIHNFNDYLDTWKYPPADVIVRTWWDIRHSGFLLYSSDYSEYYFTPKKWPEFDEIEFNKVIDFFKTSKRNFWK
jgi:undecaprenyl diphosphate synthase